MEKKGVGEPVKIRGSWFLDFFGWESVGCGESPEIPLGGEKVPAVPFARNNGGQTNDLFGSVLFMEYLVLRV